LKKKNTSQRQFEIGYREFDTITPFNGELENQLENVINYYPNNVVDQNFQKHQEELLQLQTAYDNNDDSQERLLFSNREKDNRSLVLNS
jgi:hypothetical protein